MLVVGFICNYLIKAVNARYHMKSDHEAERAQVERRCGKPAGA